MLHHMQLHPKPFEMIKNGTKTIELRLYDEKRQRVQAGDFIAFSRTDCPAEVIQTRVTALHCFDSFSTLYQNLPLLQCGYTAENIPYARPSDMEEYYSCEKQLQYGVIGIELRTTELQRFLDAQEFGCEQGSDYATALREIRNGLKETHWIWYVFPQVQGLRRYDEATARFAIRDLQEAQDYYAHPILRERLIAISCALLALQTDDPMAVLGYVDAFKLRSCMTLFREAASDEKVFRQVLDKFCMGMPDEQTLELLERRD